MYNPFLACKAINKTESWLGLILEGSLLIPGLDKQVEKLLSMEQV